MEEADSKYGKKGVATAGLTLGIIGTALAGLGGVFGGGNGAVNSARDIEIERQIGGVYQASTKADYETYITLARQIAPLEQAAAVAPYQAELAKERAERYCDNKIAALEQQLNTISLTTQAALAQKVNGVIGLPWSSIISGIPTMPSYTLGVSASTSTTTTN
jgi:hypothetical protein